ncbi:transporter [Gordonibacter urolithinfaciens]|nr:transporter [Gordonibacter urolithinfaciens]
MAGRFSSRCKGGWAKTLITLHLLLLFYTLSGILSKIAADQDFLSWEFIFLYGGMLVVLFVYAIGWQQIIKRLPLTLAFANKAVTVVWGMLWGVLLFHETVNAGMVLGAVLVIAGIAMYSTAPNDDGDGAARKGGAR